MESYHGLLLLFTVFRLRIYQIEKKTLENFQVYPEFFCIYYTDAWHAHYTQI